MKLKAIEDLSQLKPGVYIRAVFDDTGSFWQECVELRGRSWDVLHQSYKSLKELGIISAVPPRKLQAFESRILPFSFRAWSYLQGCKDVNAFASAVNNRTITPQEVNRATSNWALRAHTEAMLQLAHERVDDRLCADARENEREEDP